MKTTIDLPEDILLRAKITAAQRRTTLKELVIRGLLAEMDSPAKTQDDSDAFVAALSRGNNTERPIGKIHRNEIYDRPIFHRL